ncbi:MAG: DUF5658 family protein [Planctomycetota bacterium]|jgi:hypothetical protein
MLTWLNVTLIDRDHLMEQRLDVDRRERPTPMVSRYWLRGRRRGGRRDGEAANIYVDRYAFSEMFLVVGVLVLSVLDMVLTLVHLSHGGREANPIMASALEAGGETLFIVVKLASTIVGLFVLLVHVRFKRVRPLLTFAFVLYAALFVFHMYLVYMRQTGQWVA